MKFQAKTAFLTVLSTALIFLFVMACSDESAPEPVDAPAAGAGPSASALEPAAPVSTAPEPTGEDSAASQSSAGPDADVSASSSASAGGSAPDSGPPISVGPTVSAGPYGSYSSSGSSGASSGQDSPPDNVMYGTIAWPAGVVPPPGSVLEIELVDVSLQDAPAELIVGQVILDPGAGPVDYYLEFHPSDIKPENTYAVQAMLSDPMGQLMFTNDVAYDVLTQGHSNYADVELVAVFEMPMPPSDGPGDATVAATPGAPAGSGGSGGDLAEVPAPITGVQVAPLAEGFLLTATYLRPAESQCGELSSYGHEVERDVIRLDIYLTPAKPDGGTACAQPAISEEMEFPLEFPFEPGATYWVVANEEQTNQFSLPEAGFPPYVTVTSHVETVEWNVMESFPPQYSLWVVTAMPQGSGCSRFNGFDIARPDPYRFEIAITHHIVDFESAGGMVACTADIAMAETAIHLGSDFEPGQEYTVVVNDKTVTIDAQ